MRGADASAGTIKSGGKTRRAAKMVVLDVDHPDIEEFIWCKSREEEKARSLQEAGYDMSLDSPDWASIQYQNANNSVRLTDEFMRAVEADRDWNLTARTTGEVVKTVRARDLMHQIADAAWRCADPGIQFDTIINDWHTCPNTGRINASNPCSEYMHVDNSACNLASLNLMRFRRPDGEFDVDGFQHAVDIVFTAQEILVSNSSYPTEQIGENAHKMRQLGLGYANLGALLMARGLPYDSDEGRAYAAAITALMTGRAYRKSAEMAARMGPFSEYERNRQPMVRVIEKHRAAVANIEDRETIAVDLVDAARGAWDEALELGREHGYRNAQATVLAPTGTISFLMDCDTTGVEPDFSLVKTKRLVGGGELTIVNGTVPLALQVLGYTQTEGESIVAYIADHNTVVGAPAIRPEHLAVFDCAMGDRAIDYNGHVSMMGAVQPFISGAISKTANMPETATVDDVAKLYLDSWKMGVKALAIYRDNCKVAQPMGAKQAELVHKPMRKVMPIERMEIGRKFQVGEYEGYIHVGLFPDGTPGDVFVDIAKEGTTLAGLMNALMISVSLGLQYGVPLDVYVSKFSHMRFEPSGLTNDPDIRVAKSLVDYIFRWLGKKFLDAEMQAELGIMSPRCALACRASPPRPSRSRTARCTATSSPRRMRRSRGRRASCPSSPRASGRSSTPGRMHRSARSAAAARSAPAPATRAATAATTPAAADRAGVRSAGGCAGTGAVPAWRSGVHRRTARGVKPAGCPRGPRARDAEPRRRAPSSGRCGRCASARSIRSCSAQPGSRERAVAGAGP